LGVPTAEYNNLRSCRAFLANDGIDLLDHVVLSLSLLLLLLFLLLLLLLVVVVVLELPDFFLIF